MDNNKKQVEFESSNNEQKTNEKFLLRLRDDNNIDVLKNGNIYEGKVNPLLLDYVAKQYRKENLEEIDEKIMCKIIENTINVFSNKRLCRYDRYSSYDFCYLYFQENKGNLSANMEYSCMYLWSYLSSWGMLRGSTALLQCSHAVLEPLINYFDSLGGDVWDIDVDRYDDNNIHILLGVYKKIETILKNIIKNELSIEKVPTITLVTKIMLGVFGNVPAFDRYFKNTFHKICGGFNNSTKELDKKDLINIGKFCSNKKIQKLFDIEIKVIDFKGNETNYKYKKAKLIDMYGFSASLPEQLIANE